MFANEGRNVDRTSRRQLGNRRQTWPDFPSLIALSPRSSNRLRGRFNERRSRGRVACLGGSGGVERSGEGGGPFCPCPCTCSRPALAWECFSLRPKLGAVDMCTARCFMVAIPAVRPEADTSATGNCHLVVGYRRRSGGTST
jgi:hypothetical protein